MVHNSPPPQDAKEMAGISGFCVGLQDAGETDALSDSHIQAQSLQKLTDLARTQVLGGCKKVPRKIGQQLQATHSDNNTDVYHPYPLWSLIFSCPFHTCVDKGRTVSDVSFSEIER